MSSDVKYAGRQRRVAATVAMVIYLAVWALGSAPQARAAELVPPPKPGQLVWLTEYLDEVHIRRGFHYTLEDVVPQGKAPYKGLANLRLPMATGQLTLRRMISSLRKRFPELRVWRDHLNRRIVHIAMATATAWKQNPLDQKLSFHGTMSIEDVESHIIQRLIPKARFYYITSGQHTIPYFPNLKPLRVKHRFNIKKVTLRQFLSTGLTFSKKHLNRLLWSASLSQAPNGKFTGRVNITICDALAVAHASPPTDSGTDRAKK